MADISHYGMLKNQGGMKSGQKQYFHCRDNLIRRKTVSRPIGNHSIAMASHVDNGNADYKRCITMVS